MNSTFELFGLTLTFNTVVTFCPAFFALIAITLAKRNLSLLLSFCSVLLAAYFKLIDGVALFSIVGLFVACFLFSRSEHKWITTLTGIGIFVLSVLLFIHAAPGFNNPMVIESYQVSSDAVPYSKHLNFDKLLVALALLCFVVPSKKVRMEQHKAKILAVIAASYVVGFSSGVHFGLVQWDMKLSPILFGWVLTNLFITCYAEEAFFRGFIQVQVQNTLSRFAYGNVAVVIISGLLFGLAHLPGGAAYTFIATILGISCAYSYQKTQNILVPIFVHFVFNLVHFCFFTYPFIAQA